jgi:hypothetical protein
MKQSRDFSQCKTDAKIQYYEVNHRCVYHSLYYEVNHRCVYHFLYYEVNHRCVYLFLYDEVNHRCVYHFPFLTLEFHYSELIHFCLIFEMIFQDSIW